MNTAFSPVVNHLLATSLTQPHHKQAASGPLMSCLGNPAEIQHISYTIILLAHKLGRDHCLNPRPSHSLNYNIIVQREKVSKQMSIFLPNLFLLVL